MMNTVRSTVSRSSSLRKDTVRMHFGRDCRGMDRTAYPWNIRDGPIEPRIRLCSMRIPHRRRLVISIRGAGIALI